MGGNPVAELKVDKARVLVFRTRSEIGRAAAHLVADLVRDLTRESGEPINMVFAAAPSQDEFLEALVRIPGIDWGRVQAFHLDEYLGLPPEAPQRFSQYLQEKIFSRLPFKKVFYIDPDRSSSPEETCARYRALLDENPLHVACIGIGENGHIAFNDPPLADFQDPCKVKVVKLEERSRRQQVNDGCFPSLEEVPTHAVTLTVPAIMEARTIVCVVPGARKREAVKAALNGPISPACPASILRKHPNATIFLDEESASLIL